MKALPGTRSSNRPEGESLWLIRLLIARCRPYLFFSAFFALLVDLLHLASPLYLINVYDHVLSSGSRYTLVMLSIAFAMALLALVLLDDARARLLMRAGLRIDRELAEPLVKSLMREGTLPGAQKPGQAIRDLDNFRQVLTGPGIMVLFDAPWIPIFTFALYLLHPLFAVEAIFGAIILLILAVANEFAIRRAMSDAALAAQANYARVDDIVRNAEVSIAMGMERALLSGWAVSRSRLLYSQFLASGRASAIGAATKFVRYGLQGLVVATAVWLILDRAVSPGTIFPAMILLGRALAPVEQAVGSWKSLVAARHSFKVVARLLSRADSARASVSLGPILGTVEVDRISVVLPQRERPILRSVSFTLEAGSALGIVGANGSGKSTLARVLTGVWPPSAGTVRIDGAIVTSLNPDDVHRAIGYVPQDVQLLTGTVRENIARFQDVQSAGVVAAAQLAHVHEQILRLPDGYDTQVGDGGGVLSAGLRQRIALARAVFADPQILILDEPNSNLDADAEAALLETLHELRLRQKTLILIAHRPSLMSVVDQILVLSDGSVEMAGPRADILSKVTRPLPVKGVGAAGGGG